MSSGYDPGMVVVSPEYRVVCWNGLKGGERCEGEKTVGEVGR
jgi:hypothetical protein